MYLVPVPDLPNASDHLYKAFDAISKAREVLFPELNGNNNRDPIPFRTVLDAYMHITEAFIQLEKYEIATKSGTVTKKDYVLYKDLFLDLSKLLKAGKAK